MCVCVGGVVIGEGGVMGVRVGWLSKAGCGLMGLLCGCTCCLKCCDAVQAPCCDRDRCTFQYRPRTAPMYRPHFSPQAPPWPSPRTC